MKNVYQKFKAAFAVFALAVGLSTAVAVVESESAEASSRNCAQNPSSVCQWNLGSNEVVYYSASDPNCGSLIQSLVLQSQDGVYQAVMQCDGNFVIYKISGSSQGAKWATNTSGCPSCNLALQGDGNVVVYNYNLSVVYWASGGAASGSGGQQLRLETDGNLVTWRPWASYYSWDSRSCNAPSVGTVSHASGYCK